MDQNEDQGITAYHGSPHDFEQFDTSKIGTGEGNATYGHGLYFAQNEDIAKEYRDQLSGSHRNITIDGTPFPEYMKKPELLTDPEHDIKASIAANMAIGLNGEPKSRDEAIVALREAIKQSIKENPKDADKNRKRLQLLDKMAQGPLDIQAPQGRMYEVHINAHPNHFLDWDEVLEDQNPHIKEALQRVADHDEAEKGYTDLHEHLADPDAYTGGAFYRALAERGREKEASEILNQMGIKGIRYKDAGSRFGNEKPSYNYVIFDHNNVAVKRKYARGGVVHEDA